MHMYICEHILIAQANLLLLELCCRSASHKCRWKVFWYNVIFFVYMRTKNVFDISLAIETKEQNRSFDVYWLLSAHIQK